MPALHGSALGPECQADQKRKEEREQRPPVSRLAVSGSIA
jgi:hypothetical protein